MGRKATEPQLKEGRVYRTRDLGQWSKNPSRLAKRLVGDGRLRELSHGLYECPRESRFGLLPPSREEDMSAFLKSSAFVFTGPEVWNSLGLGSTALHAYPLVYNTKRTGEFRLGNRTYRLRRVNFPRSPSKEWFVVDLLQNHQEAGVTLEELAEGLQRAMASGRFDARALMRQTKRFGTRKTQDVVQEAVQSAPTQN